MKLQGSIIFITGANRGLYSVSKAAAWSLTNGLRNESREQETHVPGLHIDDAR